MGPWSENLFTKRAAKPFIKDSRHDHVTSGGSGKPVQPGSTSNDRNDVDVLGTRVVSAVHDRSDGEGKRHAVLGSGGGGCSTRGNDDEYVEMGCMVRARSRARAEFVGQSIDVTMVVLSGMLARSRFRRMPNRTASAVVQSGVGV